MLSLVTETELRLLLTMIDIHIEYIDNITLVNMKGELDSRSAPDVQEQLLSIVNPKSRMVLDMSDVNYMSSAGLRTLLLLYRRLGENVGRVIVAGLNDEVREVMEITGFLDFFATAETRQEAIQTLS